MIFTEGATMYHPDLPEKIAAEIMNTIEREQRINKDDLIAAATRCLDAEMRRQMNQPYVRYTAVDFGAIQPSTVVWLRNGTSGSYLTHG
mgnify:CR=1 FL=1|jgi:hypothetical protein